MNPKRLTFVRAVAGILLASAALFPPAPAQAQNFNDLIEQLGVKELARDYLRPGVDAVGYSINSGYSHTARVDTGFHVWIGAKLISTYIPDADRSFVAMLPELMVSQGYPQSVQTATVVGGEGATIRSDDPSTYPDITLPDGTGLSTFVTAMPQISFGPLLGTDIILRGLPPSSFDDKIGKFSFYGAGIKHELTHYLDVPFDLAVVAGYQTFTIGDVVDGNSLAGLLQASVFFNGVTVFGGLGYESYTIDVSYISEDPKGDPVAIDLDFHRRNLRFAFGGAVSLLGLLDLTAEYSFGIQDNLTLGIGLNI
ncbi:MAG: hypothetical protein RBU27_03325 [Bacteroidota bacterium]|jgi:hypothetical protein|nr:hypothetical protein [Bacteroidota bacterium]